MSLDATRESIFQNDIIQQMLAQGWQLGTPQGYNRETALYEQDVLDFVQQTQAQDWQKFQRIFPQDTERHFLETVVAQLKKADINATDEQSRSYHCCPTIFHKRKLI